MFLPSISITITSPQPERKVEMEKIKALFNISSADVLSLLAPNWVAVLIHPRQSRPQSRTHEARQDTERRGRARDGKKEDGLSGEDCVCVCQTWMCANICVCTWACLSGSPQTKVHKLWLRARHVGCVHVCVREFRLAWRAVESVTGRQGNGRWREKERRALGGEGGGQTLVERLTGPLVHLSLHQHWLCVCACL